MLRKFYIHFILAISMKMNFMCLKFFFFLNSSNGQILYNVYIVLLNEAIALNFLRFWFWASDSIIGNYNS